MKKFVIAAPLLCFSAALCLAQTPAASVEPTKPKLRQAQSVTAISDAEWELLINALQTEDWKNSSVYAARYLKKLTNDNERKQLARLRYFYLYALAGKILAAYHSEIPIEKNSLWLELETAAHSFTGKEVILPPRRLLVECKDVLNYICAVKNNERALRVTATNRQGTMIHSFEYVLFDEKIALDKLDGNENFLGGRLKNVEFNQDLSKPWVMRLIFDKGFVRVVVADDK